MFKCPGSQKFNRPYPEHIKCPSCAAEVEIWSDDVKAVCPKCKKEILREQGQSCLDWCKYAKECIGDKFYAKYLKNKRVNKNEK